MTLVGGRVAQTDSSLLLGCIDRLVRACRVDSSNGVIVALEVDHFENIGQTFGSSVADEVLSGVVDIVQRRVGAMGPDLFVDEAVPTMCLLLSGIEPEAAGFLVQQLRCAVAGENLVDGHKVTVSAGVAVVHHDDAALACLARAHAYLDDAKRLGRDRVSCEAPL